MFCSTNLRKRPQHIYAKEFIRVHTDFQYAGDSAALTHPTHSPPHSPTHLLIVCLHIHTLTYPPTHSPVLLSGSHAHLTKTTQGTPQNEKDTGERVIQTMKWGLIPSWHKGDLGSFPTLLNNCRSDGMTEKASFRTAVQRSQRCVVLADG